MAGFYISPASQMVSDVVPLPPEIKYSIFFGNTVKNENKQGTGTRLSGDKMHK
jgi:hypothetical protein